MTRARNSILKIFERVYVKLLHKYLKEFILNFCTNPIKANHRIMEKKDLYIVVDIFYSDTPVYKVQKVFRKGPIKTLRFLPVFYDHDNEHTAYATVRHGMLAFPRHLNPPVGFVMSVFALL